MTKIARYFLVQYLRPLSFSFGALVMLVLVSELMEQLDKFLAGGSGPGVIFLYLLNLLPMRSVEVMPVAALLAALFCLGNLSRRQEITAVMCGGIHPWRCVRPLLACGLALSALSWGLNELVVPSTSRRAKNLWDLDIRRFTSLRQTRFDNVTAVGRDGAFYSLKTLDLEAKSIEGMVVDKTADGRPRTQIQAVSAQWLNDGGWLLQNGTKRTYGEDGATLKERTAFSELEMPLGESPEDLAPQEPNTEEMNYNELNRYLRRLRALGVPTRRLEVDMHLKLALPWANLIVLLLGIPFAFQKSGGKVRAIGFALGVAFFYFGLMQVGRAIGQKPWFNPLLGAWLANLIFLSVGSWLFLRMRKLS